MQKYLAIVILLVLFIHSPTANSSDLIPEQWIYDAVEYLNGFQIQSQKEGIRSLNRYQVALSLANIIQNLELSHPSLVQRFGVSKEIYLREIVQTYNASVDSELRLPEEYLQVLSKLALEFHEELEVLGYAVQDAGEIQRAVSAQRGFPIANTYAAAIGDRKLPSNGQAAVSFKERYSYLDLLFDPDASAKDLTLDGEIISSEDFLLGAVLTLHEIEEDVQVPGVAGLAGKYLFNKDFVLEGKYLHNLDAPLGSGVFQLGATVKLGDLELGGVLRALQSKVENTEPQNRAGYELSLKLGDLMVSTGRDPLVNQGEGQGNSSYTTSVDLRYGMPDSILFSAGYQIESELKSIDELGKPSTTSLGLDIPIPQGRLKFGLTQEKLVASEQSEPTSEPDGQGDLSGKQTALVGLSYALGNEADLKLNYYRFINFDDLGSSAHDYTAEFSFRF